MFKRRPRCVALVHVCESIAGELRKPSDKYLCTLAYENYFWHPGIALESKVAVGAHASASETTGIGPTGKRVGPQYQKWVADKRPTSCGLLLFPEEPAVIKKWQCFPGFMIHYEGGNDPGGTPATASRESFCAASVSRWIIISRSNFMTTPRRTWKRCWRNLPTLFGQSRRHDEAFLHLDEETIPILKTGRRMAVSINRRTGWGRLGTEARMARSKPAWTRPWPPRLIRSSDPN